MEQKQEHVGELPNASYIEKTDRIRAWSELIGSIRPFIWTAIILIVIIPLIGRGVISSSLSHSATQLAKSNDDFEIVIANPPDFSGIEQAIIDAVKDARSQARDYASTALEQWVDELMRRVDPGFLDWYFGYFNQKKMEFSAPFIWLTSAGADAIAQMLPWDQADRLPPDIKLAEAFTEAFQTEFSKRVLVPKTAQLRLEQLTQDTINIFVSNLDRNIARIPQEQRISPTDWERYLNDIAVTIQDTEGTVSNLSLKVLVGGGTYLLTKPLVVAFAGKVGGKLIAKVTGKAAAGVAAKTGGAVGAKVISGFLDPLVGIGIFMWDLWDYHHTVQMERPVLQQNIAEYLRLMQRSLLDDPENGVMAAINQTEQGIYDSIRARHPW